MEQKLYVPDMREDGTLIVPAHKPLAARMEILDPVRATAAAELDRAVRLRYKDEW